MKFVIHSYQLINGKTIVNFIISTAIEMHIQLSIVVNSENKTNQLFTFKLLFFKPRNLLKIFSVENLVGNFIFV
jgi:hypothetical protein